MELALHHVEEDGDGGLAQLYLGDQRHFQDGTHHLRDEFDLVGPFSRIGKHIISSKMEGQKKQNTVLAKLPRLYHISRISKPICRRMSWYLEAAAGSKGSTRLIANETG